MKASIYRGRAWKFGDNISTDLIMPGFAALSSPDMSMEDAARFCMSSNRPGWAREVRKGDILIAGKNFGCGSSRPAARVLQALGIQLVIAESVARIFFRNSICLGLPVLSCPGVCGVFGEGETLLVNLGSGEVKGVESGTSILGDALPADSPPAQILREGGLIPMLERQRGAAGG